MPCNLTAFLACPLQARDLVYNIGLAEWHTCEPDCLLAVGPSAKSKQLVVGPIRENWRTGRTLTPDAVSPLLFSPFAGLQRRPNGPSVCTQLTRAAQQRATQVLGETAQTNAHKCPQAQTGSWIDPPVAPEEPSENLRNPQLPSDWWSLVGWSLGGFPFALYAIQALESPNGSPIQPPTRVDLILGNPKKNLA